MSLVALILLSVSVFFAETCRPCFAETLLSLKHFGHLSYSYVKTSVDVENPPGFFKNPLKKHTKTPLFTFPLKNLL